MAKEIAKESPLVELARTDGLSVAYYRCTCQPNERPFSEQYARYSIALVRRGTFCYHANGKSYVLTPGSTLLGNAGDEYRCSHEYGAGDECFSFQYDAALLDERFGSRRLGFATGALPQLARIEGLARLAESATNGGADVGIDEIALLLAEEIFAATKACPQIPSSSSGRDRDRAVAAAELLESDLAEAPALEVLAAAFSISPFYLLRSFRRHIGLTPQQYLIQRRIQRAARLLLDTQEPVTEIAYDVGFGDLSNFVRTFHRLVGCSPRRYRQRRLLAECKILQDRGARKN